jgi:hypothetical protein
MDGFAAAGGGLEPPPPGCPGVLPVELPHKVAPEDWGPPVQ